jgi:hypothetical protein
MFFQEILQRHVDGQPKAGGEVIKFLKGIKPVAVYLIAKKKRHLAMPLWL